MSSSFPESPVPCFTSSDQSNGSDQSQAPTPGACDSHADKRRRFERAIRADILRGALRIAAQLAPRCLEADPSQIAAIAAELAAETTRAVLHLNQRAYIPGDLYEDD